MWINVALAICLLMAFSWASAPVMAATTVWIHQAPPELRVEPLPPPRRGSLWAPGHWDWRGGRHVWVGGTWVRERRGYVYTGPTWVERNGRWQQHQARWSRGDRDGDGVPNRLDRRPDDPSRR